MDIGLVSQIETWNQMVRAGQGAQVARELALIPRNKIPTPLLAKVVNLCWRINMPTLGLRLLFPELRRQAHRRQPPPPDALAEYAGCLLEIGALGEARTILKETRGQAARANFYLALLAFKEWDYQGAQPLLESYLNQIPDDYHALVVRVNLLACYVINRNHDKALLMLGELRPRLEKANHHLLLGNTFEIESQLYYQQNDHSRALLCLEKSESFLSGAKNMGWLYCKKWQFLNHLKTSDRASRAKDVENERKALTDLASRMASWETVRDLDLHWALHTQDAPLLHRVYFGSPVSRYRERVKDLASKVGITVPPNAVFKGSGRQSSGKIQMHDLRPQEFLTESDGSFLVKKLLLILASDFYAPFRVGQVFSQLFPDEFYDVETSPDRVFQLVRRSRNWLGENRWHAEIAGDSNGYQLQFHKNVEFKIDEQLPTETLKDKSKANLSLLEHEFGARFFTAGELCHLLKCSKRSANRVLKDLQEQSQIERIGKGPATQFRIKNKIAA